MGRKPNRGCIWFKDGKREDRTKHQQQKNPCFMHSAHIHEHVELHRSQQHLCAFYCSVFWLRSANISMGLGKYRDRDKRKGMKEKEGEKIGGDITPIRGSVQWSRHYESVNYLPSFSLWAAGCWMNIITHSTKHSHTYCSVYRHPQNIQ